MINSLSDGIDLDECKRNHIALNKCYDNDGYGIHISGNGDTEDNSIISNECYSIDAPSAYSTTCIFVLK